MMRRRWAAGLLIATVIACGGAAPRLSGGPDAAIELGISDPAAFRYSCGGFPFDAAILLGPGDDERGTSPSAAALRKYLATPPAKTDGLPESGWHAIGDDGEFAEFVTPIQAEGEVYLHSVSVREGWRVSADPGCRPQLVLPAGIGRGSWELDPDGPKSGSGSRVVRVLVQEHTCSSGQPPLGRIVGPVVLPQPQRVYVVFGVRPLPGASTCQMSPSSAVEIDLGEAIGNRVLVDPFAWPHVVVNMADDG